MSVIEKCVVSWSPLEQTKPFFPFTVMPLLPFSFFPLRNAVMKRLPFGRDGWMLLEISLVVLPLLLTTPRGDGKWLVCRRVRLIWKKHGRLKVNDLVFIFVWGFDGIAICIHVYFITIALTELD